MIFLIPENYEGDINIFWSKQDSKKHMMKYQDDFFVLVISGNPERIELSDEPIPSGPYEFEYYYFSKDKIYQINSTPKKDNLPEYPNAGGAFSGYLGNENYHSFFVHKDSLSHKLKSQ